MEKNYLGTIWKRKDWQFFKLENLIWCDSLKCRDYRAIPALDRYDAGELDESDYDAISESGRREAERIMRKRDQEMGVGDMRRGLFYGKVFFCQFMLLVWY